MQRLHNCSIYLVIGGAARETTQIYIKVYYRY